MTTSVPPALLAPLDAKALEAVRAQTRKVVSALGRPYYERDGFVLYHGDCRDVLRVMRERDVKVALTVTSPPYNIGKEYEESLDPAAYRAWCAAWMSDVATVTSERGAFWLNVGYHGVEGRGRAVPIAYLLWESLPMFLQQEVVWHYGAGVSSRRAFAPRNEKWLFLTQDPAEYVFNLDAVRDPDVKYPKQRKNGKLRCNPLGKNPSDVWAIPKVTSGKRRQSRERTGHPAQFPLLLVDRIIKVSSNPGDVVLDPFNGSGSAGIAAIGNGRAYLGIERREDYCRLTADRCETFLATREEAVIAEETFAFAMDRG